MISKQRSSVGSAQSPTTARTPTGQPFLSVSVTDPVKLGNGVQAYVSYRVVTKAMERARSQESSIFRKKPSDFMQIFKVQIRP